MEGLGKKALYTLSASYDTSPVGTTIPGASPEKDQLRKDISAIWTDSTLLKGAFGLDFKPGKENGIVTNVSIVKPIQGEKEDNSVTYHLTLNYKVGPSEFLINLSNNKDTSFKKAPQVWEKNFRSLPVDQDHFEYVVGGKHKNGNIDQIWTSVAGFSMADFPSIAEGKTFSDYTFQLSTPFDKDEVAAFASFSKPVTVDYESDYVFTEREYEETAQRSTIPEALLPNFYFYLTQAFAETPGIAPLEADDLMSNEGSWTPLLKETKDDQILNKKNKPFFAEYVRNLNETPEESKQTFQRIQENIGITDKNIGFIKDYNDKAILFPMHNRIEFDTQKLGKIATIIKQAKIDQPLMKWLMSSFMNIAEFQSTPTGFFFGKSPFIVSRKVTSIDDAAQEPAGLVDDLAKIMLINADADQALDLFAEGTDNWYLSDVIEKFSSFIGNAEGQNLDGGQAFSFYQVLLYLIAKGKFKKLVKEKARTFEEILQGKPAYSEIVMYRVAKHPLDNNGVPTSLPTQNYWVTNSDEVDKIILYDTQVKYDKSYRYFVYAYTMVIGTEYEYRDLDLHKKGENDTAFAATCWVETKPKLRIMQVPYYGFSNTENSDLHVYDDPPPAPDLSFYPIRGSINKLKIFMNGNVDRYEMNPIIIEDTDEEIYDKIRKYQKKKPQQKIKFETDDSAAAFQVFRIDPDPLSGLTKAPTSYEDFKDNLVFTVNQNNPAPAGSLVDTLQPNRKYYYCFRTIDIHNNISIPTQVYEVEIQSQPGISLGYLIVNLYEFGQKLPKVATKPFRRYLHLRTPLPQIFVPQVDGEDNTTAIGKKINQVGVVQEKIFANKNSEDNINNTKKFKIRLTSKQTGRKIDVNVRFVHKQTE